MVKAMRIRLPAGVDSLVLDRAEPRNPGPGEVQFRVRASSLNYHDYAVVVGALNPADGRIPLSDAAGEVIAVGEGVDAFKAGDKVISTFFPTWLNGEPEFVGFGTVPGDGIDGFAQEIATVAATGLTPMPEGYSFEEAATLPCAGVTAWRALAVNGQVKPGETVLIQGSGGVSTFALQLAKAMGARVIATSSSEEKLARLQALGADHVINYRATPKWGEAAARLTERGVDHVVEIGGAGTIPQSIKALKAGGHIALIGVLAGREGAIATAELMQKQGRLQGLTVGSRRHQLDFVRACNTLAMRPVIDSCYPLASLSEAFHHQLSGTHFGKICITI